MYLSPPELRARRFRRLWLALLLSLGMLVLTLLDHALYRVLLLDPDKSLERRDWWQVLRQFGSLYVWIIVAVLLWAHDLREARVRFARHPRALQGAPHRAVMVFLAAGLAGLFAELLKFTLQRARPTPENPFYRFRWRDDFEGGLGLASSHTSTAFAGAIMLAWFFPALRWPLLLLATGTAATRLLVGAHYVTDVYVGILLAAGTCHLLWFCFSAFPGGERDPLHPRRA